VVVDWFRSLGKLVLHASVFLSFFPLRPALLLKFLSPLVDVFDLQACLAVLPTIPEPERAGVITELTNAKVAVAVEKTKQMELSSLTSGKL
jgi:hypothetical protein